MTIEYENMMDALPRSGSDYEFIAAGSTNYVM
jgi:hypothetical protein